MRSRPRAQCSLRGVDVSAADTRALAEMEPSERPVRIAPPLPDLQAPNDYPFAGPAGSDTRHWKARALAAEAQLDELRRQLARYRFKP